MHDICVTTRYDESITGGRHFNYISNTMTNIKVEQNQYRKSDNIEKVKPSDIETLDNIETHVEWKRDQVTWKLGQHGDPYIAEMRPSDIETRTT
jgi:hypothetical protein